MASSLQQPTRESFHVTNSWRCIMPKGALITGITGQDGSYLAEFLLSKGYQVYGLVRRSSTVNYDRIQHIQDHLTLISGDMLDQTSMQEALIQAEPEQVYTLPPHSFLHPSSTHPIFT